MTEKQPGTLLDSLEATLDGIEQRVVACSGGIDSLLLATVAHRARPHDTMIAHTVTPAVPAEGTARVTAFARAEGWQLHMVRSNEFDDERYLANPTDRCYYCKTNLYGAVAELASSTRWTAGSTILSGANLDDLGEYRPGLIAAAEHAVRHPYIESHMSKADIRSVARHLGLAEADLPASPCLASRLYTGTRVTANRLRAVEMGEAVVRSAGLAVVRCRLRGNDVLVEVPVIDREVVTRAVLNDVLATMTMVEPSIESVALDRRPYRPGQAVLEVH